MYWYTLTCIKLYQHIIKAKLHPLSSGGLRKNLYKAILFRAFFFFFKFGWCVFLWILINNDYNKRWFGANSSLCSVLTNDYTGSTVIMHRFLNELHYEAQATLQKLTNNFWQLLFNYFKWKLFLTVTESQYWRQTRVLFFFLIPRQRLQKVWWNQTSTSAQISLKSH